MRFSTSVFFKRNHFATGVVDTGGANISAGKNSKRS
jgi:hypothetical protein